MPTRILACETGPRGPASHVPGPPCFLLRRASAIWTLFSPSQRDVGSAVGAEGMRIGHLASKARPRAPSAYRLAGKGRIFFSQVVRRKLLRLQHSAFAQVRGPRRTGILVGSDLTYLLVDKWRPFFSQVVRRNLQRLQHSAFAQVRRSPGMGTWSAMI